MYGVMYYVGLILSIVTGILCVYLFFKLNMIEVFDYYLQTSTGFKINLNNIKLKKKNKDNENTEKTQKIVTLENVTINEFNETTVLDEKEISLEAAKRYATTLLDDDYDEFQSYETEFVCDGTVKSIPTTLL